MSDEQRVVDEVRQRGRTPSGRTVTRSVDVCYARRLRSARLAVT